MTNNINLPQITQKTPTEYEFSGIINFENITDLLKNSCEILDKTPPNHTEIKFNFAGISQSNTAGLALLTGLLRHAHETHKNILFLQLPAKLLAAAQITDLDKILPCTPMTSES